MKKILTFLAVLLLVFSGWFVYQKTLLLVDNQEQAAKKINVKQSIDQKNGPIKFKTYQMNNGNTALDLLKKTNQIETKGEGANAYIIEINKVTADSSKREYWAFYVNDKPATVGAGGYKLNNGDKIEWRIEKY